MAMKFWFGKTDVEPSGPAGLSEDAPASRAIPDATQTEKAVMDFGGGVVQPASETQGGCSAATPVIEAQKPLEQGVLGTAPAAGSGRVGAPAPAAAKVVLKAIGGGVRVAAQPVASTAVATPRAPVSDAPAQPMVFGLRPKAGSPTPAPVAADPAPTVAAEAAKRVVEREADETIVRPKVDQRALYYQLMNGLYDALLILDDQGHVVDCSTRAEGMLGYTREDAWDLPIGKVIPGMSSQMFEHLKRNLDENHHILIDARCVRKDGSSFSSEVGVSTLSLTRGSNMVFAIRNVERRKSALEDLRKSRAALEVALVPTFVCDPDGFFLLVNQALLEAFGIPDEAQAKSVRFMDLLPDAARFFLRAACGEKLREKMEVPTPGNIPVKLELSLLPVQSGQTITAVAGSILQL